MYIKQWSKIILKSNEGVVKRISWNVIGYILFSWNVEGQYIFMWNFKSLSAKRQKPILICMKCYRPINTTCNLFCNDFDKEIINL